MTTDKAGLQMKYFVLNPTKRGEFGKASRYAVLEYARIIEKTDANLAADLRAWVDQIMMGIAEVDFGIEERLDRAAGREDGKNG